MTLGEYIKRYRKEHDLSQRQFAAQCGLSNGYISMLERGENPKTHKPIKPTLYAVSTLMFVVILALLLLVNRRSKLEDM